MSKIATCKHCGSAIGLNPYASDWKHTDGSYDCFECIKCFHKWTPTEGFWGTLSYTDECPSCGSGKIVKYSAEPDRWTIEEI